MATAEEVLVKVQADISDLKRDMGAATRSVDRFGDQSQRSAMKADRAFRRVGAGVRVMRTSVLAAVAAVGVLGGVFGTAASAAIKFERQQARVSALLKATGSAAGFTREELVDLARDMDRTTLASKRQALDAIGVLLTFTNIQGREFTKTIRLAGDLAEVMGGDLKGATLQLAKALEDPATGLTMLRRVGVSFEEQLKNQIITLQKAGRLQEAQGLILQRVSQQVGGAAEGAAKTTAGAIDGMVFAWTEFKEKVGDQILPSVTEAVNDLRDLLSDPKFIQSVADLAEGIIAAFRGIGKAISATTRLAETFANTITFGGLAQLNAIRNFARPINPKSPLGGAVRDLTGAVVSDNDIPNLFDADAPRFGGLGRSRTRKPTGGGSRGKPKTFRLDLKEMIFPKEFKDGLRELEGEVKKATDASKRQFEEIATTIEDRVVGAFDGMVDALVEGRNAGEALKNTFKGLLKEVASSGFRLLIRTLLTGGSGSGGLLGGLLKRADGGPVTSGVPTLVGERGPEVFTPGSSGTITPNNRMGRVGGGQGTTIIADLRGADVAAVGRLERMVNSLDANLEKRAVGAMVAERIKGGSVMQPFGASG